MNPKTRCFEYDLRTEALCGVILGYFAPENFDVCAKIVVLTTGPVLRHTQPDGLQGSKHVAKAQASVSPGNLKASWPRIPFKRTDIVEALKIIQAVGAVQTNCAICLKDKHLARREYCAPLGFGKE